MSSHGFQSPKLTALGISGTHYNRGSLLWLVGKATFGHIVPKYAVHLVDAQMLRQCMQKLGEGAVAF
jgi:D-tyrosyl-tRNA(Tyr) deacylase